MKLSKKLNMAMNRAKHKAENIASECKIGISLTRRLLSGEAERPQSMNDYEQIIFYIEKYLTDEDFK